MFSKKMVIIVGVIVLLSANILVVSITASRYPTYGLGRIALAVVTPFQKAASACIFFLTDKWHQYFLLVSVSRENKNLRNQLDILKAENERLAETALANTRLRDLLGFKHTLVSPVVAAEVIGKDPSAWFRTVTIDKGLRDGVRQGLPVLAAAGVIGQVVEASDYFAKVILIIDVNSAVDALVQRTRARGIIKGQLAGACRLDYVLNKHDVRVGDAIISSGLDGVYPKGQRIGFVASVVKREGSVFQDITITPYINFEKLEEVLVVLTPSHRSVPRIQ
jgi:rod shape-determining protein MreC